MSESRSFPVQWPILVLCILSLALSAFAALTATQASWQMQEMMRTMSAIQTSQAEMLSTWNVDNAEFRESLEVNNAAIDELYTNQEKIADRIDGEEIPINRVSEAGAAPLVAPAP